MISKLSCIKSAFHFPPGSCQSRIQKWHSGDRKSLFHNSCGFRWNHFTSQGLEHLGFLVYMSDTGQGGWRMGSAKTITTAPPSSLLGMWLDFSRGGSCSLWTKQKYWLLRSSHGSHTGSLLPHSIDHHRHGTTFSPTRFKWKGHRPIGRRVNIFMGMS